MPATWPQILGLTALFVAELQMPAFSTQGKAPEDSGVPSAKPKVSVYKGSTAWFVAFEIRSAYQLALTSATTTMGHLIKPGAGPAGAPGSWNKGAFEDGWFAGFSLQSNTPTNLQIAPYMAMALGTVNSWIPKRPSPTPGIKFMPAPPIPALFPAPHPAPPTAWNCHTVFPGTPMPLGLNIWGAFTSGSPYTIAPILVQSFSAHMMTVTGVYWGMMPAPAPGPPIPNPAPMPWVGVI